jgi:hypothetical protein
MAGSCEGRPAVFGGLCAVLPVGGLLRWSPPRYGTCPVGALSRAVCLLA